ncbi:MAG TPA: flavodoxin family protein [Syntrophales bacterium]|nr:flavodoxin family protein [Syntrophobacterales bacterium]HQL91382.1 flavodoxin family protein [Syntrophales bacterium]
MKVIAFNGSARKDGNTAVLLNTVLEEIRKEGIETELYQLAGKKIQGCIACMKCMKNRDRRCAVDGDIVNECISKMIEADGILLGSPTYFADVSAATRALIERAGYVARANDYMLKRKVGAGVIAVRRGGAIHAFNSLNLFFFYQQIINPGSSYWAFGVGREPGEVLNDAEGIQTMKTLGQNVAWLLNKLRA